MEKNKEKDTDKILGMNRTMFFVIVILLCILSLSIGIYAQVFYRYSDTDPFMLGIGVGKTQDAAEITELKNNFNKIFTNDLSGKTNKNIKKKDDNKDVVYTLQTANQKETNKYNISATIPKINIDADYAEKINAQIKVNYTDKIESIIEGKNKDETDYSVTYKAYLNGDLFAVLDADMIPKKEFLSRTVGYFTNENLAFVQVPQVYYNKDTYQYNLMKNIPNEQDFFMRDIQEARAAINAVLHVGTNALFKREYVDEIGGYPTCSITEDMAVGMLLQSKGYDSVFINEELVLGLSATTFTELVKQRDRWCRGNIQVLKYFNPIFTKGLTLPQKIAYFDGGVYWFSNLQKIIFISCPLIYLLTRKIIIDSSILNLLNIYIPFILGQILIFNTLSPGNRKLTWSHFYEIAMAPHLTLSILKEMLFFKTEFNVTLKEIQQGRKQFQFKVAFPHIVIVIVTIIAWIVSTRLLIEKNIHVQAYLLNMGWSIYNFIGAIICIKVAYQKPIFRTSERISINEDITVECTYKENQFKAKILNLSEKGIGLKLNEELELQCEDTIKLDLKGSIFICKVSRIDKDLLGLSFNKLKPNQMKLIMSIFTENMQPYYKLGKSQEYIVNKKEVSRVS